jgi:8-oxo-dGTP diphosphatase
MIAPRTTRYQAAILCGAEILLIRHREQADGRAYWVIPGGGQEPRENESECVRREAQEETNLEVRVEGLLLYEPPMFDKKECVGKYQR